MDYQILLAGRGVAVVDVLLLFHQTSFTGKLYVLQMCWKLSSTTEILS